MNCQEFRSKWEHSIDDTVYAHIETCDDCLNWIEKSTSALKEAIFLKEYPAPSVELEDRIMQTIYQTAGNTNSPLSATVLPATGDSLIERLNKRRFFVPTWVAAAGVLVAVGLIGGPLLLGSHTEQFAEIASAPAENQSPASAQNESNASKGASSFKAFADSFSATATSAAAYEQSTTGQMPETATVEKAKAATKPAPATTRKQATSPQAVQEAPATPPRAASAATAHQHNTHVQLPARAKPEFTQSTPQPAATDESETPQISDKSLASASVSEDQSHNTVPSLIGPQLPSEGKEASSQAEAAATSDSSTKQGLSLENPITLSTFNDVDTAVQASDLPVPTLAKVPADYAINKLTLQYESQTSKHVSNIQTVYQQASNGKRITVDVTVQQGKRSLSVPGEFSSTQVFQIDGDQAIGVTYKDSEEPSATKSAVHYQVDKGGHSLYVVITANGIPLGELIELAKQVSWKAK